MGRLHWFTAPRRATHRPVLVKENGLRFYSEITHGVDYEYVAAAMAWTGDPRKMNGGGPIWAIFDAEAVAREKWQVKPPYVDTYGYFFSADTLDELYRQRTSVAADAGRRCARRSSATIPSSTPAPTRISRSRGPCIRSPRRHSMRLGTRPRCTIPILIRINTTGQVLDLRGSIIPGLYACGDLAGRVRPARIQPGRHLRPPR